MPTIDFRQLRMTTLNSVVASKPGTFKPGAPKHKSATSETASDIFKISESSVPKSAASDAASKIFILSVPRSAASDAASKVSKSSVPTSTASDAASKVFISSVPRSAASDAASKVSKSVPKFTASEAAALMPEIAFEAAHLPDTPQPVAKKMPVAQFMVTRHESHDEGGYSDVDGAVGGLVDEDDSLERDQAMSSPLKGAELQATKVCCIYIHMYIY